MLTLAPTDTVVLLQTRHILQTLECPVLQHRRHRQNTGMARYTECSSCDQFSHDKLARSRQW